METKQEAVHTNTLCIHAGEKPPAGSDEVHVLHSHTFPIFQTSSFVFDDAAMGAALFAKDREGFIYSRIGNPTVEKFEATITDLEKGGFGTVAFSSGMAAVVGSMMPFLNTGDHVVCSRVMYGPSVHLIADVLKRFGIESTVIDTTDLSAVRNAIKGGKTKIIFIETPGNPIGCITDISECSRIAHSVNAMCMVDSTFASPVFQNPLLLGADITIHSITKYINGHGDVVGGVSVCSKKEQYAAVRKWRQDTGAILGPFDAFLALRGVKTLAIRMSKHNSNAIEVARYLQQHPKVAQVLFAGLESSPGHALAEKQMAGFGGTFSFTVKGGFEAAKKLIESTKLATLAVSLGTLDTLVEHPASMTHASVPIALMKEQGLSPDLIRISIGLEDAADIIADLDQALAKC